MEKDIVSVIMLSHNSSQFVEESAKSVLAQTYTNWELLFVDDNSKDDTIEKMMELKGNDERFKISQVIYERGTSINRNAALSRARGRWIAFLDAGDVWHPEKLEKQIAFMEGHGYSFSYTSYGLMNERSESRGVVIGGKEHVTYQDMIRCCWPSYVTVMYDAEKVGLVQVRDLKRNNDYALWLSISKKNDCHLLNAALATIRTNWSRLGGLMRTDKVKWRYEVYRKEEGFGPVKSLLYTVRNGWYGIKKWQKYVKRVE